MAEAEHDAQSESEPISIQEAVAVPVIRSFNSGTVIACFIKEYKDEEPQLGMVTTEGQSNSSVLEIEWMSGAYTKPWKVYKEKNGQTWKETISTDCILFSVALDKNNKLSTDTVKELKLAYNSLKNSKN